MFQNFLLKNNNNQGLNYQKYPSLNGLRGVSIILVILFHFRIGDYGPLGVNVFFVISGFLITIINLKEYASTGTISLLNFYKRRILRILPLLFLYISILLVLNQIFHLDIAKINIFAALAFLLDFSYFRNHGFNWFTGHLWSLAIEEQFYFLIPIIFKINIKAFIGTILFLIIVLPLLCLLQYYFPYLNKGIPYYFTHFLIKFQSIAVGCLLAILVNIGLFNIKSNSYLIYFFNWVSIAFISYLNYDPFFSVSSVFKNLIVELLIGFIIISNLYINNGLLFKLLNTRLLSFIGVVSYSLYMWNPLFTSKDNRLPPIFNQGIVSAVILLIVATISYYLYEKQFLKLKSRINLRPSKSYLQPNASFRN